MPRIYHVNWFRVNKEGKFLWPGYGDNIRVVDWMCKRIKGEVGVVKSAIGLLPEKGTLLATVS